MINSSDVVMGLSRPQSLGNLVAGHDGLKIMQMPTCQLYH